MNRTKEKKKALTNAEHQARWRQGRKAELDALKAQLAALENAARDHGLDVDAILRKTISVSDPRFLRKTILRKTEPARTVALLRKTLPTTDDERDQQLTTLRQTLDALVTAYLVLVPSLNEAEIKTIADRFAAGRTRITTSAKGARPRVVVPMKQAK